MCVLPRRLQCDDAFWTPSLSGMLEKVSAALIDFDFFVRNSRHSASQLTILSMQSLPFTVEH